MGSGLCKARCAGFRSLHAPDCRASQRIEQILNAFAQNPSKIDRQDILELELNLIALQPVELLLQRAPRFRSIYREIIGEKQFAMYKPVEVKDENDLKSSEFRDNLVYDLQSVMSDMHWHYTLEPHRDKVQRDLTHNVIIMVAIYTGIWAFLVVLPLFQCSIDYRFIGTTLTVVYAGILGGFVSALQRIQSVRVDADSLILIHELNNGQYFLWFAPLIGALFALVLMVLFMSNLLGGTLFPSFAWEAGTKVPRLYLLPSAGADYSKLFFWSFIAGFSERFVPDAVDRLLQRAREAEQPRTRDRTSRTRISRENK